MKKKIISKRDKIIISIHTSLIILLALLILFATFETKSVNNNGTLNILEEKLIN